MATNRVTASDILEQYGVSPMETFDVAQAASERIDYLADFLRSTGRKAYVLGISGGVDSTVAGVLAQRACEKLRAEGYPATFVAMRLPAGVQADESDAQAALAFMSPDVVLTVNVGGASTVLHDRGAAAFLASGKKITAEKMDFDKGNVKARMRMIAQYQQAAQFEGLVLGTDHNAEAVMGFFTMWGDGACDVTVLGGLNKRQVRAMAKYMGAPQALWSKPAMADLEELNPGQSDDASFGFPYDYLDDFLEGKTIPEHVLNIIVKQFNQTLFKRKPIAGFSIA